MVGLLYLPRLYVYHNDKEYMSDIDTTFLVYENDYLLSEVYFLLKLVLVFILSLFHIYLSILYKDFKKGYRYKSTKFFRIINEIPTILMIVIIFLVIVRPDLQSS